MLPGILRSDKIDPKQAITHRFKLRQVPDVYDAFARAADTQALKVVIEAQRFAASPRLTRRAELERRRSVVQRENHPPPKAGTGRRRAALSPQGLYFSSRFRIACNSRSRSSLVFG
jgi:hypothetical protein